MTRLYGERQTYDKKVLSRLGGPHTMIRVPSLSLRNVDARASAVEASSVLDSEKCSNESHYSCTNFSCTYFVQCFRQSSMSQEGHMNCCTTFHKLSSSAQARTKRRASSPLQAENDRIEQLPISTQNTTASAEHYFHHFPNGLSTYSLESAIL